MSNLASALKEEIVRLARKEIRGEIEGMKKASAQYRSDIAALKRRVVDLEKQVNRLSKEGMTKSKSEPIASEATGARFSSNGLAKKRQKLGLSASEMGVLLGVSAQTVYNWEAGKTRPSQKQMAAVLAARALGKRQATAMLVKSSD